MYLDSMNVFPFRALIFLNCLDCDVAIVVTQFITRKLQWYTKTNICKPRSTMTFTYLLINFAVSQTFYWFYWL